MKRKNRMITAGLVVLSSVIWFPLFFMAAQSLMGSAELIKNTGAVLAGTGGKARFTLLPQFPTLEPYVELLLDSPGFFVMFWNSCKQVFPILLGQLLIGMPAAWALGRYKFRGRNVLMLLYMILMIMPFQVTMVSGYLVLKKFQILDTHFALILPGIFNTFPVFIMTKAFAGIPDSLMDAARIDGAGEFRVFTSIGIPMALPGIISAAILGFLECWNVIEQPMTFLKTKNLWPLSLYLPNITADKMNVSFAASIVMMLPAVFLFLWGQAYLEQGIAASGLKE